MVPHKARVKMVKIRVRLTSRVTSHLFLSGTVGKKNRLPPDLNVKICSNNDKKVINTVINKQAMYFRFF